MEEKLKSYLRKRLRTTLDEIQNSSADELSKKIHLMAREDELRKALNFIQYGD